MVGRVVEARREAGRHPRRDPAHAQQQRHRAGELLAVADPVREQERLERVLPRRRLLVVGEVLLEIALDALHHVVGGRLAGGELPSQQVHPAVWRGEHRVHIGPAGRGGRVPRRELHELLRLPGRGAGQVEGDVGLHVRARVDRRRAHLRRGRVRHVRRDVVGLALAGGAVDDARRAVARGGDRVRPVVCEHGAGRYQHVRVQVAERDVDAVDPALVEGARQRARHVGAGVVVRVRPARAVEAVERLRLPVVRPVRPHLEEGAPGARPVERAVVMVPIEALPTGGAEPAPVLPVDPRLAPVDRVAEWDRDQPGSHHDGRGHRRVGRAHPREPEPGGDQHQEREPAHDRVAEPHLGDRERVQPHEQHQRADPSRLPRARPAGHERERGSQCGGGRAGEQDGQADPHVAARIRPGDRAGAGDAAVDPVAQIVPVGGREEAGGQPDRRQGQGQGGEREAHLHEPAGVPRQADEPGAHGAHRGAARGGDGAHQHRAAGRGLHDERVPVERREQAQRGKGHDPQRQLERGRGRRPRRALAGPHPEAPRGAREGAHAALLLPARSTR